MSFNPSSITVYVGTKITWTNKDAVTHNVTSNTTLFSSGSMTTGATFSYTFTTAGTFPYTCTIHPSMTGTVTVTEAPATPGY
jgi:plastocyanin